MPQPNDHVLSLYRNAMQSATELMNVYLHGIEHIQRSQQAATAIDEARNETSSILSQIQSANNLQELYNLQARLGRSQMEKIITYWTSLCATANLSQIEFMRQAQIKTLELVDTVGQTLDGSQAPGTEPVLNAMKMVVNAARSSYAATVRATEQAALETAAQIESAAAQQEGSAKSSQAA